MSNQGLALRKEIFNEVTVIMNRPDFKRYGEDVALLVKQCKKVTVKDDVTERDAVQRVSEVKGLFKTLDETRKEALEKYRGIEKAVNNAVKQWTDPLGDAERYLKREIQNYQSALEMQRRKEEEIARQKADKLRQKIQKEADKMGLEAPEIPEVIVPKRSNVIRGTGGGKVSSRKVWKTKLLDIKELALAVGKGKAAKELLVFNQGLADTMARNGVREIPGVEIYQDSQMSVHAA